MTTNSHGDWRVVGEIDGYHVFTPSDYELCLCDTMEDALRVIEMGRVFDAHRTLLEALKDCRVSP